VSSGRQCSKLERRRESVAMKKDVSGKFKRNKAPILRRCLHPRGDE
jgi:hypothetical protein